MKLVIDTNRIIAALIRNSASRALLIHPPFSFYIPDSALTEISRHASLLCTKARLDRKTFENVLATLFACIHVVAQDEYANCLSEAKKLITDADDVPFLALALAMKIPIWTDDKHFRQQKRVEVYTTNDLIALKR